MRLDPVDQRLADPDCPETLRYTGVAARQDISNDT